jgi:hypothetical protein
MLYFFYTDLIIVAQSPFMPGPIVKNNQENPALTAPRVQKPNTFFKERNDLPPLGKQQKGRV